MSAQALERVFTVQHPDLVDTCMYDFVLLSDKPVSCRKCSVLGNVLGMDVSCKPTHRAL